jgi:hypothetical protein
MPAAWASLTSKPSAVLLLLPGSWLSMPGQASATAPAALLLSAAGLLARERRRRLPATCIKRSDQSPSPGPLPLLLVDAALSSVYCCLSGALVWGVPLPWRCLPRRAAGWDRAPCVGPRLRRSPWATSRLPQPSAPRETRGHLLLSVSACKRPRAACMAGRGDRRRRAAGCQSPFDVITRTLPGWKMLQPAGPHQP